LLGVEKPKLYRMLLRLQILGAFGCMLAIVYACRFSWRLALPVAASGIGIAGGAALLGLLFGFIFCFPRIRKEFAGSLPEGTSSGIEDNSSLADISDWLTKIIIGVGLVELNKIPNRLNALALTLSAGLRGSDATAAQGQVFALALLLYFFPLGFLFGFIWTRFYYQEAVKSLLNTIRAYDEAEEADAKLSEGHPELAAAIINSALTADPDNPKALFVKARILKRQAYDSASKTYSRSGLEQALEYAKRASERLPDRGAPLYNMACYQALLGLPAEEVIRTLRRALEKSPALVKDALKDPDFDDIKNRSQEFRDLLKEFAVHLDRTGASNEGQDPGVSNEGQDQL
jgi:hypothetical protein